MRPSGARARRRSCRRLPSCGGPRRGKCRAARDAVPRYRLCLLTVALAVSGCGGPFPQSTLEPRSDFGAAVDQLFTRSEEHTSELQSRLHLVCRLLLEKKKKQIHCEDFECNYRGTSQYIQHNAYTNTGTTTY